MKTNRLLTTVLLTAALSFAGCSTTDVAAARAVADPIVASLLEGLAASHGVPPVITAPVITLLQNQAWGMVAQAQAGNTVAQGSSIPTVGNAVQAAVTGLSSQQQVTQLTAAIPKISSLLGANTASLLTPKSTAVGK